MKNTSKSSKIIPKSSQDSRKDWRSAPEISGSLKKGGHGGKFTWAGDGSYSSKKEEADVVVVDANDPNFDELEENPIDES
ncbi:hypothetical protein MTR67_031559 [Solanum verrucosum]|uniref:Programmed cell death protein 4-like n=1 Tax=Solanum verrucosum TaxID=315347 RepID=A0AAF0U2Q8_SOLVR|nr:hypothetical protein MTR67_031559 [Solanum verrucosum]